MAEVNARGEKPRWVVVYMHLSPFTVSRAKRLQCFVPKFEKYKIPLVICGHNHTNSRSIPLYTGYQKGMDYFDYQTTAGVVKTKNEVENKGMMGGNPVADETLIKHNADPANGTYYVMINATGYKLSGKEKIVSIHNDLKASVYNSNPTIASDGNGEPFYHDNGAGQPWWYKNETKGEYVGAMPKTSQPTYAMINITANSITIEMKQIKGVLVSDVNKNVAVQDYGTQTIETYDKLVINYNERNH